MFHNKIRIKYRKKLLTFWVLCFLTSVIVFSGLSQASTVMPTGPAKVIARCDRGALLDMSGTRVLLLAGSPYEMGYQHGKLLKPEVQSLIKQVLFFVRAAEVTGIKGYRLGSIENAFERTQKFIDQRYLEEMRGLADGAEIGLKDVQLANVFPELFHCSGFALFGKATVGGKLLHGRILDYMTEAGLQYFAVVIAAKPDGYNSFVNVGYTGFLGSVTGMNDKQIAIGEMGGGGEGNWDGMPMSFLIRKTLEEADTLDKAVNIFKNTQRTCEYYYVISDGKISDGRGLACSSEKFEVIEPGEGHRLLPHKITDAVLMSADERYEHLASLVKKQYGKIDVPAALELMNRPVAMESCLHRVLFSPMELKLWVANAAMPGIEKYAACYQPYYTYDFKELLAMIPDTGPAGSEFRAAIAVRNVTPDTLLPVSGGVGASKPVRKKIGELTVRALVLENGGTRVAICSTDFLGFPSVLCNKVRSQVSGIRPENILIGATHTHSAPDCYGFPDKSGETAADIEYLNNVCAKLAEAINEAVANLQPAQVKIATGKARGKIAYNYYAEQLYDPRCNVIQVLDIGDRPFATLVNYACHPEIIGPGQGVLCPDFVGPLYDRIKENGGGTGIFINGAEGGMVTADCRGPDGKDIQTWDECVRIGYLLADESLRIIADSQVQENPELFCSSTSIKFPVDSEFLRTVVKLSPLGFEMDEKGHVAAQVNIVNIGNAQILTIPGEALPNIGYYLKRKMHGEHNFLFGLTNDAFGYILTKVDWNSFKRYDYISKTCLGEMTGEIFIEEALRFVDKCPRPASSALCEHLHSK